MKTENLISGELYKLLPIHPDEAWSYHWNVSELQAGTHSALAMNDVSTEHPIVYLETKVFDKVGELHTFLACSRIGDVSLVIGLKDNHVRDEVVEL